MSGWDNFENDEKIRVENMRKNKSGKYEKKWVREGGREMIGSSYFLSKPTKTWSPQIKEFAICI